MAAEGSGERPLWYETQGDMDEDKIQPHKNNNTQQCQYDKNIMQQLQKRQSLQQQKRRQGISLSFLLKAESFGAVLKRRLGVVEAACVARCEGSP